MYDLQTQEDIHNEYLAHYGVKGMKWGVRRYQDYDGNRTKKAVKNFNDKLSTYESARDIHKAVKEIHKKGGLLTNQETGQQARIDKSLVKETKGAKKTAKRDLNDAYKRLKTAKRADEGAKLYNQGERITELE